MKKVLLGTIIGFLLFAGGLYVGYIAIENIRGGGTPLFVLGSIILCGAGMAILYKSGRLDTFKSKIVPLKVEETQGSILDKNQQLAKDWEDANQKRDKLKILGAAAANDKK